MMPIRDSAAKLQCPAPNGAGFSGVQVGTGSLPFSSAGFSGGGAM